jgi:hypothetical protein
MNGLDVKFSLVECVEELYVKAAVDDGNVSVLMPNLAHDTVHIILHRWRVAYPRIAVEVFEPCKCTHVVSIANIDST